MFYVLKGFYEHLAIFRNGANLFGQNGPRHINSIVYYACDFVWVSSHFKLRQQGKNCLRRNDGIQSLWQPFLGRRIKPVLVNGADFKPAILKNHCDGFMPSVLQ